MTARFEITLKPKSFEIAPKLKKILEEDFLDCEEFKLEICFLQPKIFRKPIIEEEPELSAITTQIHRFLKLHLLGNISSQKLETAAKEATTFVYWTYPSASISSTEFRSMLIVSAFISLIEEHFNFDSVDDETGLQLMEIMKLVAEEESIESVMDILENDDRIDMAKLVCFAKSNPLLVGIIGGLRTLMVGQTKADFCLKRMNGQLYKILEGFWTRKNLFAKNPHFESSENEGFLGNKRPEIGGITGYIVLLAMMQQTHLPQHLLENPIFKTWNQTTDKLCRSVNSLLGIKRGLQTGNLDGIIASNIGKGIQLKEAVAKELKNYKEHLEEYKLVRKRIINNYDEDFVCRYVELVDSFVYGYILNFGVSERYGIRGELSCVNS